jgi:2-polyprenyl-3-methyl-5-hydroxy-6-metoxy-1,4-benzoquinol methylase
VLRYRSAPRGDRIYVSVKLRTDPVASLIASLGWLGDVVDVGSGRGQLGLFLLEAGRISSLQGFDWDSKKVEIACGAALELPARFDVLDVTDAPISPADTVLLIDVLHYLPLEAQRALVDRAARSLRPGGRLVVREADRSAGWRARLTILAEKVGRALGVNRAAQFAFASADDLCAMLERAGLRTEVAPAAEGTPLANVLLIGKKD